MVTNGDKGGRGGSKIGIFTVTYFLNGPLVKLKNIISLHFLTEPFRGRILYDSCRTISATEPFLCLCIHG